MAIYRCADGRWIHLHGALPHLRDGTLALLGCEDRAASIAAAVARWHSFDLEDALAAAGQCGAVLRSAAEWAAHPQGVALAHAPLVELRRLGDAPRRVLAAAARPLAGLRVLDLTRILAGPTCARTLAEHGAEVLRLVAPRQHDVPSFVPDTSHGKRVAWLDLDAPGAGARLRSLVAGCDVFSQGYRGGALEARGFGAAELARLRPGIVCLSINAYGHEGPWATRRGWEQLAQACTGVALEHSHPGVDAGSRPAVIPRGPERLLQRLPRGVRRDARARAPGARGRQLGGARVARAHGAVDPRSRSGARGREARTTDGRGDRALVDDARHRLGPAGLPRAGGAARPHARGLGLAVGAARYASRTVGLSRPGWRVRGMHA